MQQREFEINESEYPFASHWFEYKGADIHFIDEGEGIPVVMCHGNPTWSYLYRKVVKQLKDECRCIAYDLPGFGFSGHPSTYAYTPQEHAECVQALLMDHLKLDKFIIVVQDWGGPIGLTVATNNPESIHGVVASSTWAWESSFITKVFSAAMRNSLGQWLILNKNVFVKNIVPAVLGVKAKNDPTTLQAYIAPFPTPESRKGPAALPEQLIAAKPWLIALERRLHTLSDKPVEFVFGMKDLLSRPAEINRWLSHFPDANVQKVPDAAHYTQEDCPENYAIAVRNILQKV